MIASTQTLKYANTPIQATACIENACSALHPPQSYFESWLIAVWRECALNAPDSRLMQDARAGASPVLCVRLVCEDESQTLNRRFRGRNKNADVLAFPARLARAEALLNPGLLGDLAICATLVQRETERSTEERWAHLLIHGTLHLLGYDHKEQQAANIMEALETRLLRGQGYSDPYRSTP